MSDDTSGISYGARRAVRELTSIFDCQWSNGMLPQIRFVEGQHGYRPDADDWGVTPEVSGPTKHRTSGITQPPVIGMCAWEVFHRIGEKAQAAFLSDFLRIEQGLQAYHAWLLRERDPLGEKLVVCLHPWETGTDNSPAFDPLIEETRRFVAASGLSVDSFGRGDTVHVSSEQRPTDRDYYTYFGLLALFKKHGYNQQAIIAETPFLLQDVLFNSVFAESIYGLADLQAALAAMAASGAGADGLRRRAEENQRLAAAVAGAIRARMWGEGGPFFYSYDLRGARQLRTATASGFMPFMAGIATPEQAGDLTGRLGDDFWTPLPVPSTSPDSPAFNPIRYWSGPSWPVTNWLIARGLLEQGWHTNLSWKRLDRKGWTSPFGTALQLRIRMMKRIEEGFGEEVALPAAMKVLEENSVGEEFTTPSTRQYQHAWLWDSAIAALGWLAYKPDWRLHLERPEQAPGFWEYYNPHTGAPLGAPNMTWTAALYLARLL